MERLHQEANPSLAPWKPPGISEHDASMPKSSRQMLLVEREVACGVLGHNYATLGRRPGQYLRIVQMSEVGRGRRGCHIMSTLSELFRNCGGEMLVVAHGSGMASSGPPEQSAPQSGRRRS